MAEASTNPIRPQSRNHAQFLYWSPRTANEPLSFLTESGGTEFFRVAPDGQKIQANTISGLSGSSIAVEGVTLASGSVTSTSASITTITAGSTVKTPILQEKTSGGGVSLVGNLTSSYNILAADLTASGDITAPDGNFTRLNGFPRFPSMQPNQPLYLDSTEAMHSASPGSFRALFEIAKNGANSDITSLAATTDISSSSSLALSAETIVYLNAKSYHRVQKNGSDIWRFVEGNHLEPYNGNWNIGNGSRRVGGLYSQTLNTSGDITLGGVIVPPYDPVTDWGWTNSSWAFFGYSDIPSLDPAAATTTSLGNAVNMIMKILTEAGLYQAT